jgi:hypothetical protein
VYSEEGMENWTSSNFALQFPISFLFNENFNYYSLSIGVGTRIKTFADLYIHPSISFAMINETHTVTKYLLYTPYESKEIELIYKVTFHVAFEYTVHKYTAIRRIGPYRYLTHLNPLVRVYGDLGPIIGLTYVDGIIFDAGINWREHQFTSSYSIQYHPEKKGFGFLMSFGFEL